MGSAVAGLPLLGGIIGAQAQMQAGAAAKQSADQEAKLLEFTAADTERAGGDVASRMRMGADQTVGTQRTVQAANGVEADPMVEFNARFMAEWSAQQALSDARREAWGLRNKAAAVRAQGAQMQSAADNKAVASILGGAVDTGSLGYKFSQTGVY